MDLGRDLALLVLLAGSFIFSVFIAAAETAFIRMPALRVEALASGGSLRARRLASLMDKMPEVLNAILLGALLSQIVAATVAGVLAERWFGSGGPAVASALLTVVLYIYAEAIPKTYAVRHTDRVALALSLPLAAVELVFRPLVTVLVWVADIQMPGKGVVTSPTVTEGELRRLASRAAIEGEITRDDAHLIERAFRVGDRQADDVMVPRLDIVAVPDDASVEEALEVALDSGHRRLPVYTGSLENITGVVRLRDLVPVPAERRRELPVGRLAEQPLVVPESKRVLDLLQEMQASGTHLAVVVDEYGGTAGLVTVEDIAEELLGSITEKPPVADVADLGDGRWVIDGALPVEDLAEIVDEEIDDADWNTAAGLVLGLLGRLPRVGDQVIFAGHALRVVGVRGRRITRLEVTRAAGGS
jgi:CBS domain containing-hemolysin-like protein